MTSFRRIRPVNLRTATVKQAVAKVRISPEVAGDEGHCRRNMR
ncbi:hypothetical protein BRCON_2030 [Candidatus Sumerlaea chitinivorans]|uniref:Uncharacterized protein n=1 Tax=Sumerlaea chitinivorans TaxID=2250252 RepID=A0A2Z4Y6F1_SUMC1|nr:hypothetical protein BRCON_2030 [Candidatus Sumerlaea chitinivorans]